MTAEFHHLSPVILTQELFDRYSPELTIAPREEQYNAAFLIAEQMMVKGLTTPLLPSQVSGTFSFPYPYQTIMLPHVYVRSLDSVVAYGYEGGCNCDIQELDACGRLRNHIGWIDTKIIAGHYVTACGAAVKPEYYDIAYTAGLSTGTAADDASLHMALAHLARIELLEMLDPGALEGGGGDAGVRSYSTVGYSETRTEASVKKTPFGNSALANKAWNLVEHLYISKPLRFGR
jgi:hypothetical protein